MFTTSYALSLCFIPGWYSHMSADIIYRSKDPPFFNANPQPQWLTLLFTLIHTQWQFFFSILTCNFNFIFACFDQSYQAQIDYFGEPTPQNTCILINPTLKAPYFHSPVGTNLSLSYSYREQKVPSWTFLCWECTTLSSDDSLIWFFCQVSITI